jgi:hypothetical protein
MNLASIMRFIEMLELELSENPSHKIVYVSEEGKRNMTNSSFLLGCYLILVEKQTPEQAWSQFQGHYSFELYRDATFATPDFGLSLLDCWRGLACGQALGWVGATPDEGLYDLDEYEHYDSFLNGELHIVVPDKFVAFRGPKTLEGDAEYEDIGECRVFSAHYYVDIFKEIGVTTVIRLNEPEYDSSIFTSAGIELHDLEFEDCTAPSNQIVSKFLRIVDQAPGMIAVHCKAGLGRTGTLIALYAMLAHRFSARDVMGWLRIVRPGSVIGDQQQYLCDVEKKFSPALFSSPCAAAAAPADTVTDSFGPRTLSAAGDLPFARCRSGGDAPLGLSCDGRPDDSVGSDTPVALAPAARCYSGGCEEPAAAGEPAVLAQQVAGALERRGASQRAAAAAAAAVAAAAAAAAHGFPPP